MHYKLTRLPEVSDILLPQSTRRYTYTTLQLLHRTQFVNSVPAKLSGFHSFQVLVLDKHTNNVTSVAFNSEGQWLVSGSEDSTIRIWDLRWVWRFSSTLRDSVNLQFLRSTGNVHRTYDNGAPGCTAAGHPMKPD
jgi:WD40 repeat protein